MAIQASNDPGYLRFFVLSAKDEDMKVPLGTEAARKLNVFFAGPSPFRHHERFRSRVQPQDGPGNRMVGQEARCAFPFHFS